MNKLTKRLTAIGAAMTMAVSMMSVGASAYQVSSGWYLNYASAPGMPSSSYHQSITRQYQPVSSTNTFSVFNENCSSFYSGVSGNGVHAKVRYWTYVIDKNGNVFGPGFESNYHEVKNSTYYNHYLGTTVDFNHRLVVRYELINDYFVSCEMSGTYRLD